MGYRDYSTAKGHIVDATGHGDFTTITAAITAAVSGQTVFIRPGTYPEDPPLKAAVNLAAFDCDWLGQVNILGKCTFTGTGTVSLSGIQFTTNSDFALAVTGSNASVIELINCSTSSANNTAISFTSSNSSAAIVFRDCKLDTSTTGVAHFSKSSPGVLSFISCSAGNTGASTTANTNSAGGVSFTNCFFGLGLNNSSSSLDSSIFNSIYDNSPNNQTMVTTSGTGFITIVASYFASGTASAISIGAGTTIGLANSTVNSSNTNAITGTGTLDAGIVTFTGTSSTINGTLTVNKYTTFGGTIV